MLLFDMPMEKLKVYEGRNPKPADFDAFWDKSLAEMHGLDPEVELRPASFTCPFADCYDLYFTGVGGSRIHAKYLRPKKSEGPHPAVLMFHGYSGSAGDWNDKLNLVGLGYSVFALDCRGQGGLSEDLGGVHGPTLRGHIIRGLEDKPENLLFRNIFLDTAELARIAMGMDEVDPTRVGAMGGSQGGGLTLACVSLEPKVKLAAPTFPFLCDYKRVWEMEQAKGAYEELRTFFRQFDPNHEREDEIFTKLGYIDVQFLTPRIKAEVLMGVGLEDTICPPSTQFAAYNRISSKKNLVIYPDYGHESLPRWGDHVYSFMTGL